jgi:hypothetical protein
MKRISIAVFLLLAVGLSAGCSGRQTESSDKATSRQPSSPPESAPALQSAAETTAPVAALTPTPVMPAPIAVAVAPVAKTPTAAELTQQELDRELADSYHTSDNSDTCTDVMIAAVNRLMPHVGHSDAEIAAGQEMMEKQGEWKQQHGFGNLSDEDLAECKAKWGKR